MLKFLLVCLAVQLISGQLADTTPGPSYTGLWGTWKTVYLPYTDMVFACAAEIRFDAVKDATDNSGANGLRMRFCNFPDWSTNTTL
jgi:hypothetical protein